ncbi:hypothetical protein [Mobilicoccus caccae]|uniref:hypothetical protein n=1 Tax=Mobilicoccus caccae TaxID=1859295 RepID=UPI003D666369
MPANTPAARLRIALDLFALGEQMMRARLQREHPEWTETQTQVAIQGWLRERPGAEFGDCPGQPVALRDAR